MTTDSIATGRGQGTTAILPTADSDTTIYCPQALRTLWPSPLAGQWHDQYPNLFDQDDLRLAHRQPTAHFYESFAAIHLFHRDGAVSLIEKYDSPKHRVKFSRYCQTVAEEQRLILQLIHAHVQPPDLLVISPDGKSFSFAEVKGPTDRLRQPQEESHAAIRRLLGVPVEVIRVRSRAS